MPETAKIPVEKVRQLQRKLYVCAKQSKTRRFHALYDRISRSVYIAPARNDSYENGGDQPAVEVVARTGYGKAVGVFDLGPRTKG